MPEFTSEQQEFIKARDAKYLSYIRSLHHVIAEYGYRVAALEKVLYDKGLATPKETQAAEDEIRAALMVEKVVNPRVRAAEETLRALLGET
jgi:hypothetical protein